MNKIGEKEWILLADDLFVGKGVYVKLDDEYDGSGSHLCLELGGGHRDGILVVLGMQWESGGLTLQVFDYRPENRPSLSKNVPAALAAVRLDSIENAELDSCTERPALRMHLETGEVEQYDNNDREAFVIESALARHEARRARHEATR